MATVKKAKKKAATKVTKAKALKQAQEAIASSRKTRKKVRDAVSREKRKKVVEVTPDTTPVEPIVQDFTDLDSQNEGLKNAIYSLDSAISDNPPNDPVDFGPVDESTEFHQFLDEVVQEAITRYGWHVIVADIRGAGETLDDVRLIKPSLWDRIKQWWNR